MPSIQHVLLVGHCGFDAPRLRKAVEGVAGGAVTVDEATTADQVRQAGSDTLLLINRQLGYGFGTSSGLDLIRELAAKTEPPATMLVSNYADAQQQAEEAGALPGFGKAALNNPQTLERLRDALGAPASDTSARTK